MSQVSQEGTELKALDPEDIGWWIESADEETYGPVSRKTLREFLADGSISLNTLVRHCTHAASAPVADQTGMTTGLNLDAAPAAGDRLAEVWPRRNRDRLALAEDDLPCSRHKQAAVAVCICCQAPYCNRCRVKPHKTPFYCCRACQSSNHNRRFMAVIGDSALLNYVPILIVFVIAPGVEALTIVAQMVGFVLFLLRDSLIGGASLCKRLAGLRVVSSKTGNTPLNHGQGIVRWLSQFIPFYNLFDAFVPLRDPLRRRYGDRWAGTRVVETERRVTKLRDKARARLAKKGVMLAPEPKMTMEIFARLD